MAASNGRRRSAAKSTRAVTPLSVERLEARTLCTVNSLLDSLHLLGSSYASHHVSSHVGRPQTKLAPLNAPPALAKPITVAGGTQVHGSNVNLSVLGRDDKGETNLVYSWKLTGSPTGASVTFSSNNSNLAKNTKAIFSKPGVYDLRVTVADKNGLAVSSSQRVTVAETRTSLSVITSAKQTIAPGGTVTVTGTSERFSVKVLDQFGKPLLSQPSVSWTLLSSPSGGKATLSSSNGTTVAQFTKAGAYKFKLTAGNINLTFAVKVAQTVSSLKVAPGSGNLAPGATQQFTVAAFDQFNARMATPSAILWSTTGGAITKTGLLTAPSIAGPITVTAKSGAIAGTASMSIASSSTLQNGSISKLVTTLYADGSLSRPDVIQILRSAGSDGKVDAGELSDLRYLVSHAATYHMAGYVQVLASNIVNGNAANLFYQGVAAGNLAAGSPGSLLTILVDKWFMGTDLPTVTSSGITYRTAAGVLFNGAPSHNDEFQGALGDCYLISALGTIADRNPAAISNMFIDNGDGTYTVRFYTGNYGAFYRADGTISDGFTSGSGTADYVTVNRQLPAFSNGTFAYANYGQRLDSPTSSLWIALAEKAYAQWNATGKENRNGTNTYSGIAGGWMGTVDAQVLGYNATDYYLTSTSKQAMLGALGSGKSVTIGTVGSPNAGGLYGGHAYAVIGYSNATDTFNLYNPWGFAQPSPLSWAQLQTNCSLFVVADASASTPIVAGTAATSPSLRSLLAMAPAVVSVSQLHESGWVATSPAAETHTHWSNNMSDETEPADADPTEAYDVESIDWQMLERYASSDISDDSTSHSLELVDQVFDDIDALLREALA